MVTTNGTGGEVLTVAGNWVMELTYIFQVVLIGKTAVIGQLTSLKGTIHPTTTQKARGVIWSNILEDASVTAPVNSVLQYTALNNYIYYLLFFNFYKFYL